MKNTFYYLTLLFLFSFSQCRKNTGTPTDNPYGLPNATQTGANIFACRVSGQLFISNSDFYHMGVNIFQILLVTIGNSCRHNKNI